MADVSEHDSKKKGEGYTSEKRRINLFVEWDAIGVNDFLKYLSECICLNIGRRFQLMITNLFYFECKLIELIVL